MTTVTQLQQGTREELDALAQAGELAPGDLFYVTDERLLAVGTGASSYRVAENTYVFATEAELAQAVGRLPEDAWIVKLWELAGSDAGDAGYSDTEQATGATWVDGKPIYRRVFAGAIAAAAGSMSYLDLAEGVGDIVACGGWIALIGSSARFSLGHSFANGSVSAQAALYLTPETGAVTLWSTSDHGRTEANNTFSIWMDYTKSE
jgi:hypothetical protein